MFVVHVIGVLTAIVMALGVLFKATAHSTKLLHRLIDVIRDLIKSFK